jgi:phospholipase/carboxylesterase
MADTCLPHVEVATAQRVDAAVIWLHGLGADGHDFEPVVSELGLPPSLGLRFIFPHAPVRPVTLNAGMSMPAWYDLYSLTAGGPEDESGIRHAAREIESLIEHEISRGIDSRRIVLAGFSQGGALALFTGLRYPRPLAGVMGLSTYLPLRDRLEGERSAQNAGICVFLAHGTQDEIVAYAYGLRARDELRRLGYRVQWRGYPMGHQVCAQELHDIGAWLIQTLGPDPAQGA